MATEAVNAIRVLDKSGHILVGSQAFPAPQDQDLSDRDYFKAQIPGDAGTFIGSVLVPRASEGPTLASAAAGHCRMDSSPALSSYR
jgi:hypothetical protein